MIMIKRLTTALALLALSGAAWAQMGAPANPPSPAPPIQPAPPIDPPDPAAVEPAPPEEGPAGLDAEGDARVGSEELQDYEGTASGRAAGQADSENQTLSGRLMARLDADRNGTLVPEEVRGNPELREAFSEIDTDGDGEITTQEIDQSKELKPPEKQ